MDKFNKDELNPPSWINGSFFETVIQTSEKCDDVKINNFKITPATLKGDHFASIMFRGTVEYTMKTEEKEISLIIKTMPVEDGLKKDLLQPLHIFEVEAEMYSEVIPKFHRILQECGDNTIFAARLLYSSLTPHKVLVFDDLTKQGYQMFGHRLANYEEMLIILDKLCKWHAVGFKLLQEGDTKLLKFKEGVFNFGNLVLYDFFKPGLELFGETIISLPNGKTYVEKFKNIQDKLLGICDKLTRNTGDFCVLNHGDYHIRNMMFKYKNDTEELENMIAVDYQFSVVTSFAYDLLYSLYMIADAGVRAERDKFIFDYHKKFVECLDKIKFKGKIPSLEDVHTELLRYKHLELLIVATMFPLSAVLTGRGEVDPNDVVTSKDGRRCFYGNTDYLNELKGLLPRMLEDGCFHE